MQMFQWLNVNKELPPIKKDSNQDSIEVLVSLKDGEVTFDAYSHRYGTWLANCRNVTHWAPKPKAADKDNE